MPALRGRRWSLVRLDGDTYDATRLALDALYPGLAPGGYLIVDDYGALDECRRAVDEFRAEHGIAEPLEQVDWTCVRWRRESDGRSRAMAPCATAGGVGRPPRAVDAARPGTCRRCASSSWRQLAELRGASSTPPPSCSACRARRSRARADGWAGGSDGEGRAMIAFGCVDHRAGDLRALRRARDPAGRRSPTPRSSPTPPPARSSAATTCSSTRAPSVDDLEALVLVHQDAEIVDHDFCAKLREALTDPDVGVVGCVGRDRRAQHRLVGGLGDLGVVHPPLRRARRRRAAGVRVERRRAARRTRAPARSTRVDGFVLALSPWAVRNLRFDESLGQLHGYDFDFCLPGPRGRPEGRHRRLQGRPPPLARPVSDPETWIEAHMRWPRSGTAGCRTSARAAATGSSAPGAPRPRRPPRGRRRSRPSCRPTREARRARAPDHEHAREHRLAAHRAAAARSTRCAGGVRRAELARSARVLGLVDARRTVVLREAPARRAGGAARCARRGRRLRDSSSSRSTASCAQPRRPCTAAWTICTCVEREVEDAVRLEPLEQRIAVPRLEHLGHRVGPRRVARARRPRGRRTPARSPAAARRAPRRSPRPRSARRCADRPRAPPASVYGSAARAHARLAREQAAALDHRLAVRPRGSARARSRRRGARAASRRRGSSSSGSSSPSALLARSAAAPR